MAAQILADQQAAARASDRSVRSAQSKLGSEELYARIEDMGTQ